MFFMIAVAIFVIFVLYFVVFRRGSPSNLPPGPTGIPFLGYFLRDDDCMHLKELSQKYGPIFHYYSGNRLIIVLNSVETIREAFVSNGDCFVDRFNALDAKGERNFLCHANAFLNLLK